MVIFSKFLLIFNFVVCSIGICSPIEFLNVSPEDTDQYNNLQIELITVNQVTQFGHQLGLAAIKTSQKSTGSNWVYVYTSKDSMLNPFDVIFTLEKIPYSAFLVQISKNEQQVLSTPLLLPKSAKVLLIQLLSDKINKTLIYSPKDNTPVSIMRDILNQLVEGDLKKYIDDLVQIQRPYNITFRKLMRRHLLDSPYQSFLVDTFLGQVADIPLTPWELLISPYHLRNAIENLSSLYQISREKKTYIQPKLITGAPSIIVSAKLSQRHLDSTSKYTMRWISIWIIPIYLFFFLVLFKIGEYFKQPVMFKVFILPFYVVWGLVCTGMSSYILIGGSYYQFNMLNDNLLLFIIWPTDIFYVLIAVWRWADWGPLLSSKYRSIFNFKNYILIHVLGCMVLGGSLALKGLLTGNEHMAVYITIIHLVVYYLETIQITFKPIKTGT